MNTYYLQVYYYEQDSQLVDTVAFSVPDSVSRKDFFVAVDSAVCKYACRGMNEDCDYLEVTDDMLALIAKKLDGTWEYLNICFTVYVDGDGRGLSKN